MSRPQLIKKLKEKNPKINRSELEIVIDIFCGTIEKALVEERNVRQLKDAIEYLLNNPGEWEKLGKINQEVINRKFNKNNVKKLVSIFKEFNI